jgi:hypothetical protein
MILQDHHTSLPPKRNEQKAHLAIFDPLPRFACLYCPFNRGVATVGDSKAAGLRKTKREAVESLLG